MITADLIARLEAASEGSRELDEEIAHLAHTYQAPDRGDPYGSWPHYTTSLDAARELVPEGMAADIHIGPRGFYNDATIWQPIKGEDDQGRRTTSYKPFEAKSVRDGRIYQNTPALALCIAALKARLISDREEQQ
jgi:hypothetical protein